MSSEVNAMSRMHAQVESYAIVAAMGKMQKIVNKFKKLTASLHRIQLEYFDAPNVYIDEKKRLDLLFLRSYLKSL